MNKGQLTEFITHPAFISLIIWTIIIHFIPPVFSKYKIKHVANEYEIANTYFYYYDLDADKTSEVISLDLNDLYQTKIIVKRNNKVHGQYNLKNQPYACNWLYAGDYNKDGFLECFVFTLNSDSVFLSIFDPLGARRIILNGRFVDFRRKAPYSTDGPDIVSVGMVEGLNGENKDFIFYINTGYSQQPRNLYRYLIEEDSLIRSPESGAAITGCEIFDIDGDKSSEFLLDLLAPGNLEEDFPYSDQHSWFMILDKNLNFLFTPLKLVENPSRSKVIPLNLGDQTGIVLFNDYLGSENYASSFSLFDQKGNMIAKKTVSDFENDFADIIPNEGNNYKTFYFLKNSRTEIVEMDRSFNVLSTITIPEIEKPENIISIDADLDGLEEHIFIGIDKRSLVITRNNFSHPLSIMVKKSIFENYSITRVLKKGASPMLHVQFEGYRSYFRYDKNILFYLKYPFYVLLYIATFIFIFLVSRIQRYRLNLKQQTERKIAELQMKSIKNQIDPHFTLNILNAIGSLYATEENRDKADYVFGKYAKLIRQTVISSDKIIVDLAEEIDFVRNYLDLERFRSNNSFNFSIDIGEKVDIHIKIPRMLIHTFAENSVKYGIRNKPDGGFLKISVSAEPNRYIINLEDNGPGLQDDKSPDPGTGKGLLILNDLIELYYKLEKAKISYTLENILGEGDTVSGTRATIDIPYKSHRS